MGVWRRYRLSGWESWRTRGAGCSRGEGQGWRCSRAERRFPGSGHRARNGRVWVVEYQGGGPEQHDRAITTDANVVRSALVGWALQEHGWRRLLSWRLVRQ